MKTNIPYFTWLKFSTFFLSVRAPDLKAIKAVGMMSVFDGILADAELSCLLQMISLWLIIFNMGKCIITQASS